MFLMEESSATKLKDIEKNTPNKTIIKGFYYKYFCSIGFFFSIDGSRKKNETGPGSDLARTWPDPSGPGPVRSRSRAS